MENEYRKCKLCGEAIRPNDYTYDDEREAHCRCIDNAQDVTTHKHTPGPWDIHGGYVTPVADGRPIAHILFSDTTAKSDARLIAAAPELLAACDEADTAFAVINISDGLTPQARSSLRKAWAEVNRVMALATGKTDKFKAANPE